MRELMWYDVKDYKLEWEYSDFKSAVFKPFPDHINTYYLESDDDNDNNLSRNWKHQKMGSKFYLQ